jgi:transcriptional regulator with XRE-family HTH domain
MPHRTSSKGNRPTFDAVAAGHFLYAQRIDRGLSQRELARRAGVAQQTIANVEQAVGSVSVQKLEAIALALGLNILTVIQRSVR